MYSLKKRYAIFSFLLAVVVVTVAWFANSNAKNKQDTFFNNIKERSLILGKTRYIKNNIWNSRSALENFLLFPHEKSYSYSFSNAISEAKKTTNSLIELNWASTSKSRSDLISLVQSINSLESAVNNLMAIRLDADKQYPAFVVIREKMLPNSSQFLTATNLALAELSEELDTKDGKLEYEKIMAARYIWSQMVNAFRMYFSNLVGSLDDSSLAVQVRDIKLFRNDLESKMTEMEILIKNGRTVGFQSVESIKAMRASLDEWSKSLDEVLRIYESGFWRSDADLLSNNIKPIMDKTWTSIQHIEEDIKKLSTQDFALLSNTTENLAFSIYALAVVSVILILIVYIAINRVLLVPLNRLTNALKGEAGSDEIENLPKQKYFEMYSLMDAFVNMQNQVRQRQSELRHQALHDALTGLPNRVLLLDRLQQLVKESHRNKTKPAIIMMDLDRFKEINDTLGHHIGDLLLQDVSSRLTNVLRDTDTIARLGGDEFAILLNDVDLEGAKVVANKITNAMTMPFQVETHQLLIGCSEGVAMYPEHGEDSTELIKHADVAMYVAKRGHLGHSIYNAKEDSNTVTNISLSADLKNAINDNELNLYYQPKVSVHDGKVIECEALLRWIHPEKGFISPELIVEAAEQSGLIHPLTEWVINTAITQASRWKKEGIDIGVAVNLSAFNLQNPHLVTIIKFLLDSSDLEPHQLILEVTEGAMMANPKLAAGVLSLLNSMGIRIAIDDFGTGYSSLAYLKNLPVHELKIDRSFVMNIVRDESDVSIVKSTIDLAHNLGLSVVAEGVEDKESWNILENMNCDVIQGYYISRPLPNVDFEEWYVEYSLSLIDKKQA